MAIPRLSLGRSEAFEEYTDRYRNSGGMLELPVKNAAANRHPIQGRN